MIARIFIFALYSVAFEALVLGGTGYAVFVLGHSGWWMLGALYVSTKQLKPHHFGIFTEREAEVGHAAAEAARRFREAMKAGEKPCGKPGLPDVKWTRT